MKFRKEEYPFSYNSKDEEWMKKAHENYKKFINTTGVDKIDRFNFGYDIRKVFNGESPRYNPRSLDTCYTPDHTRHIYRNSKNSATYVLSFPYVPKWLYLDGLQEFCDKFNVYCAVLPEDCSFYHNKPTYMIVFARKKHLDKLIVKYIGKGQAIHYLKPKVNFYNYVMKYIEIDSPQGDLARDIAEDDKIKKIKNDDSAVFDYLDFVTSIYSAANKTFQRMKETYLSAMNCGCDFYELLKMNTKEDSKC